MKIVVISGRSGSGKTTALHVLEDIGFYCVDNLPVTLLQQLITELARRVEPSIQAVAIGIDARNSVAQLDQLPSVLEALEQQGFDARVIYLDADDDTLFKRFSETRRRHPISDDNNTLKEAIERERDMLTPVAASASLILDTTQLTLHDLRDRIIVEVQAGKEAMKILIQSFGFKNGMPTEADMVFDVRCLPNPHWVQGLRGQTGKDPEVQAFLASHDLVNKMIQDIASFLRSWLPQFAANNRSYTTVAIGCTGGQHRSVYITECLVAEFREDFNGVQARHREL